MYSVYCISWEGRPRPPIPETAAGERKTASTRIAAATTAIWDATEHASAAAPIAAAQRMQQEQQRHQQLLQQQQQQQQLLHQQQQLQQQQQQQQQQYGSYEYSAAQKYVPASASALAQGNPYPSTSSHLPPIPQKPQRHLNPKVRLTVFMLFSDS
jgi:transcription initiation factor TFIID subunit TAF12